MPACPSCQSPVSGGRFCGVCGAALPEQAPVAPATPPPSQAAGGADADDETLQMFADHAAEMFADLGNSRQLAQELATIGDEMGISQAQFSRVLQNLVRQDAMRPRLGLGVDAAAISSFVVGRICQLRLRIENQGDQSLKHVRLHWATTSCNGVNDEQTRAILSGKDAVVTTSIRPQTPGQHGFEGVLIATTYQRKEFYFGLRTVSFEVADRSEGPQSVTIQNHTNIDVGSGSGAATTRFGDVSVDGGAGALGQQAEGRLLSGGNWAHVQLSPLDKNGFEAWVGRHGSPSVGLLRQANEASSSPVVPTPSPSAPPVPSAPPSTTAKMYTHLGPNGQVDCTLEQLKSAIQQDIGFGHQVWSAGWSDWKDWRSVDELKSLIPQAPSAPSPVDSAPARPAPSGPEMELRDLGPNKIKVVNLICRLGELTLPQALQQVNATPVTIGHADDAGHAQALVAQFAEVGATVAQKGAPVSHRPAPATPRSAPAPAPAQAAASSSPVAPRVCTACHKMNIGRAPFCVHCGHPLPNAVDSASPSRYKVELCSTGGNSIQVVMAIQQATGKGMVESQQMVASTPCILSSDLNQADAQKLADRIGATGASVRLVPV